MLICSSNVKQALRRFATRQANVDRLEKTALWAAIQ